MTKKIVLAVFSLLGFGCLAWGADKTYTGTVVAPIAGPCMQCPASTRQSVWINAYPAEPVMFWFPEARFSNLMPRPSSKDWAARA